MDYNETPTERFPMFKKRTISELEKTEIVLDYLHSEMQAWCANVVPDQPTQDIVSYRIAYINEQIALTSTKLTILRSIKNSK